MATLAPVLKQRFFDSNGEPLAGGKLFSYIAGTSTPKITYADEAASAANTNPTILDANGEADVWLGTGAYKFMLTDASDVVQWVVDNVSAPTASTGGGGVTVHSALLGLSADDHGQYHTDARGDARYYLKAQIDTALAAKANSSHTHALSDLTQSSASNGQVPTWNGSSWTPQTPSGGGAGSAGKNYFSNFYDGTVVLGINRYADGASSIPVDGTGGTPNVAAAAQNTVTPLRGTSSQRLSKGSANRQGEGWSIDFTLDRADYEFSQPEVVQFRYKTSANYVNNDLRIFVYNRNSGTLLNVTSLTGDGSVGKSDTTTLFTGVFYPSTTNADYRLVFHITSTNALAWDFDMTDLTLGPSQVSIGGIITPTQSYPLTISGTTTNPTKGTIVRDLAQWSRVGEFIELSYDFEQSTAGTAGSGIYLFPLPPGFAFDVSKVFTTTGQEVVIGNGIVSNTGDGLGSNTTPVSVVAYNSTSFALVQPVISTNNLRDSAALVGSTAFGLNNLSQIYSIRLRAPIANWAASTALTTTEAFLSTVKMVAYRANVQSVSSLTNATVFCDTKQDPLNIYNTSTGIATIPKTAWYRINAQVKYVAYAAGSSTAQAFITRNGVSIASNNILTTTTSFNWTAPVSRTIFLNAGDTVQLFTLQNSGSTQSILGAIDGTFLSIEEIPDFSIFSVYGQSDYLESVSSTATAWPFAASTWGDLASITLTAGEWDVSSSVISFNNGAVTAANIDSGISTTAGNSSAGLVYGQNRTSMAHSATTLTSYTSVIPSYRVTVTVPTIVYLKAIYNAAPTNVQYLGYRLSARRIR